MHLVFCMGLAFSCCHVGWLDIPNKLSTNGRVGSQGFLLANLENGQLINNQNASGLLLWLNVREP